MPRITPAVGGGLLETHFPPPVRHEIASVVTMQVEPCGSVHSVPTGPRGTSASAVQLFPWSSLSQSPRSVPRMRVSFFPASVIPVVGRASGRDAASHALPPSGLHARVLPDRTNRNGAFPCPTARETLDDAISNCSSISDQLSPPSVLRYSAAVPFWAFRAM